MESKMLLDLGSWITANCAVELFEDAPQVLPVGVVELRNGQTDCVWFEQKAQCADLGDRLRRHGCDECSFEGDLFDAPLFFETTQRFPHRRPTDTHFIGDVCFTQLRTGRE